MQTDQKVGRPFLLLSQAIAYLLGGIFLSTANATDVVGLVAQIFGGIFIFFAFFLVVTSFVSNLTDWATRMDIWFFLALFFVSMASLIKTALESVECRFFYIVLAIIFLLLVLAALLFQLYKTAISLRKLFGNRVAVVRMLKGLSVVLSLFALAMVIMQVSIMGGPILYLSLGVVCLSVATLLSSQRDE